MSELVERKETPVVVTEEQVLESGKKLITRYPNVFYLLDFEGVLLPKAFSDLEKRRVTTTHSDDVTATERGIYRLPVNNKLVETLEKLLMVDPEKSWLVEGSSLVTIPEAEIQKHIPAFRFGIQRSREVLSDLANRTVGSNRSIKPGSMPAGSLLVVLNDESPPMGLYRHIKGKSPGAYDSYDICEIPLPVYRGRGDSEFHQGVLNTMFKAFNSPMIKRPVESAGTTTWSTGMGLASMAPRGTRIRRPGD